MDTSIKIFIKNIEDDKFLKEEEKQGFLLVVDMFPSEVISEINDLAKKSSELIPFLWSNISRKREAILRKDKEAVEKIIEEEIDFISKI